MLEKHSFRFTKHQSLRCRPLFFFSLVPRDVDLRMVVVERRGLYKKSEEESKGGCMVVM